MIRYTHFPVLVLTATLVGTSAVPAADPVPFAEMRALWDREPSPLPTSLEPDEVTLCRQAEANARFAAEAFYRCHQFVLGWLEHADPQSGLIPRNLRESRDLWNGRDSAADNYPFMVLTCAMLDTPRFDGRMLEILRAEQRLTSRLDRLGDHFQFSTQSFAHPAMDVDRLVFDNAEYVKDGLIPLTEWLGRSPWSERMTGLVEDIWKHAPIDSAFGRLPTLNFEVNGDLLQACSRLYWFTGDDRYLDWAIRLGDYYLLGNQHPTRDLDRLRLLDHGCEVVNGLSELYVAVSHARSGKKQDYQAPIHEMLDTILAKARNPDGLLYSEFNPKTDAHSKGLCDTWGYVYDAFYTVFLLDGVQRYRDAVRFALGNLLDKYEGAPWDDRSADGYADSIEGALNLYNREPIPAAAEWIHRQTRRMWAIQKPDGIIEGWHGDGNFARTTLMLGLWKTQGLRLDPWRPDLRLGAVRDGDRLYVSLAADEPWQGRLLFDRPRHKENLRLPLDYPRINQFPEWFTVSPDHIFQLRDLSTPDERPIAGSDLLAGLPVTLRTNQWTLWQLTSNKP